MSNHIPNWPARAGVPGLILWVSVIIAVIGIGGFLYTVISAS